MKNIGAQGPSTISQLPGVLSFGCCVLPRACMCKTDRKRAPNIMKTPTNVSIDGMRTLLIIVFAPKFPGNQSNKFFKIANSISKPKPAGKNSKSKNAPFFQSKKVDNTVSFASTEAAKPPPTPIAGSKITSPPHEKVPFLMPIFLQICLNSKNIFTKRSF